jgi:uncharacterized protein DUF3500
VVPWTEKLLEERAMTTARTDGPARPLIEVCSDCAGFSPRFNPGVSRRAFLRTVGGALAASTLPLGVAQGPRIAGAEGKPAETYVKLFFESLTPEQKKIVHFPFDHQLRSHVGNNWHVVDETVGAIDTLYTSDQKELIRKIFQGVTSGEGHERFQKQMKDDAGGFGNYTCAVFGEPGGKFEWVMTGRHLTIRADGNSVENTAFGGPIFYGHAVEANEKPDHPGNVWWPQARLANDIFQSLDGKQREKALLEGTPPDSDETVRLRGSVSGIQGLPGSALTRDQRDLLKKTLKSMLSMYRESDVEEAVGCLDAHGGYEELRLSFYKEGDLGSDGIWDRWRVEGPRFVWYFRGSPHVHAWVHIARESGRKKATV